MLKLGLHYSLYSHGDWRAAYESMLRQARLADKLGYHVLSVSEHHFTETGWCPVPTLPLAAAAALTRKIQLSTGVRLLLLHGAVRVAEEIAVLDVLSGGRAIAGVGLGYRVEEFEAFNAPYDNKGERMENELIRLDRLLRGEGRPNITPRPVRKPRPPIWVASKVKRGVTRAARLADAWLADPISHIDYLEGLAREYWSAASNKGRIVLRRDGFLAGSEEEAREVFRTIAESYITSYYRWGHLTDRSGRPLASNTMSREEVLDLLSERLVVGTKEKFVDKILAEAERLRADTVVLRISFPGLKERTVEEAIRRIASALIRK